MSLDDYQPQKGDKSTLTLQEIDVLENKILPTARRWVRKVPGLADQGRKTLEYWGEK